LFLLQFRVVLPRGLASRQSDRGLFGRCWLDEFRNPYRNEADRQSNSHPDPKLCRRAHTAESPTTQSNHTRVVGSAFVPNVNPREH
jgi:hypothetical protein